MMKTLLRTIGWALLCLLLVPGAAWAQTAPDAPSITTVEAGRGSAGLTLVVTWTAPASDGGSAITAYAVRSIETAADETDDANWSVEENAWQSGDGALSTTLAGLTDSTGYDVQVRAGNEQGDSAWSTTATGTTLDHGDMASEATSLPLDTNMGGVIDSGTDVDYFEFRLTRVTDMLIETRGDLDTVGELQKRDGTVLHSNDDGNLPHGPLNFFLWRALAAGTYRIKVSSYGEETTGSYTLHTTSLVETTFDNPQEIDLDSAGNWTANGLLYNRPGNPGIDTDFFKVDFSEGEHFIIRTTDPFGSQVGVHDLGAIILDSDGNELASFGDGDLWPHPRHVLIAGRMKNTGTYYIKLGARLADKGPYTLHVSRVTEPGSTTATATPLDFVTARGGTIHPLSDEDYFRLEIPAATHVYLAAVSDRVQINGELLDSTSAPVDTRYYTFSFGPRRAFFFHERLDAGTYYIKVTGERKNDDFDIDAPPYVIHAFEDTDYNRFLADCEDIDTATTISDPLYGCQWHLHNTGQLKGGVPGEDINVEEVWDDNNLGAGINVAVVDDGMDYAHEDLSANVITDRNHDYDTDDQNGGDIYEYLKNHGTAVAGLIAAQDNDLGVRGVAPQAKIYGYNLLVDSTAANEANAATRDLDTTAVSNNSWGPDDGPGLDAPDKTWEMAITNGVTNGFAGKGIFYVWAAGNGGGENPSERDNSNFDGYANYYGVTAVCAVNDEGQRSAYSEKGANLWVCAPSDDSHLSYTFTIVDSQGITTTDQDDFYRNTFGDTSAATPIVSGVAALIRKANPALSWRDVKLILAASARQNDADNTGWTEDGALQYNSDPNDPESYHFNHAYGFGVVDAKAAVDLADGWTNVPALVEETAETSDTLTIPDLGTVSSSLTLGSGVEFIEFVEINADFDHAAFRDLQLELISPSGAVSVLSGVRSGFHSPLRGSFRFGSARHLGENPAGEWTLRISDTWRTDVGELNSWSLTVYGHRSTPGAPDLDSLTPESGTLTVAWQAPTNSGASAVTGYDVRYIKTTEDETDDANWTVVETGWTSGALRYTIPNLEDDIAYDVQVRAVNAQGAGAWSDTITETPSGDAPYFTEGDGTTRSVDENEAAGAEVGLPVGAEDPTNETLTYTLSGTDAGSFDIDASTGQLTVADGTALNYEGTKKSYAVTVTATDPSDDSDSINVTITVENVDESPTLSGPDSASRAENSILPVAEYDATDPEREAVRWSLEGTDSADFTIRNGVLRFDSRPNYESPADDGGNNVYEVTVVASDRTSSPATRDVTVTVTNVDEVHTLEEASWVPSDYAENGAEPVAEYIVTDPEGATVRWSLVGADAGDFTISGGVLRFKNTPDYENPADSNRNNSYRVTVQSTAGGHTVERSLLLIHVTPVDEAPTLTGPPEVSYDENDTAEVARYTATDPEGKTIIWSVTGTDADDFDISNGVLTFKSPPNYEAATDANRDNVYAVTVEASDGDLTTPQALTVTVNNLDEAGRLTLSSEQPQVGTALTATLTDLDDNITDESWVWERRSSNSGTWTAIDDETSDRYTPVADDVSNYLRVRVSYTDGHTESGSKDLQHTFTNPVRPAPDSNIPPQFPDSGTAREVQENTPAGEKIGEPVTATDDDEADKDRLTYSLGPADALLVFTIDETSGQLLTKAALDHEDTPSYSVTVTAADPSGESDFILVTVEVTDEDEPPVVGGRSSVSYDENAIGTVETFTAADPEDEEVTLTLAGTDSARFAFQNGELRFLTPPNYEAPQDRNRDNDYEVTVVANDETTPATRQAVTVEVKDVNEPPTITEPTGTDIEYPEHATEPVATFTATDPEGEAVRWSLLAGADDFSIGESDGELRFTTPPDYKTDADNDYAVTVEASDGSNTTSLAVTVTVTNVDEAGSLTLSSVQPQVGTALTATLTDPEGVGPTDWVWERSQDKQTWEEIKGASVAGETYTPGAADLGAYLRVSVTYTDGAETDKFVQIVSPHAVRTAPVNNESPAFTETTTTRTVSVNARAGSRVGASVRAEDPGDPLTYTLDETDPDAACFSIDWISGQLTVGSGGLSPCTNSQTTGYTLTVIATDPSGESDEIPVFITVTSSPPPPSPPPPGPSGTSGPPRGGTQGDDTTAAEPTGYLENPGHNSFQSGIGVISGWVCEAEKVEIEIETERGETERQVAGYGTERLDTETVCGDTDNGFGLLFNWNLLGAGEHTVVALVDEVELGRAMVTVTTVGTGDAEEFLRDVAGECVVADFPTEGETVTLAWQETKQNFVIAGERAPTGPNRAGGAGVGYLENPGPNSFQSGIGVISGWVCEAERVEIEIETERGETERQVAAYGTERLDTAQRADGTLLCGDTDNGFGLLFNWNRLGAGEHTVVAYVDGIELGRAVVRVTTVGAGAEEEFLRGAEGECVVDDFPMPGETVLLEWQQNSQNFVITDAG